MVTGTPVTKPCKVCGEGIKLSAKKCVHCDSYQDWRSGLGPSTSVLSLLVALVAVLTAAVPVIHDGLTAKNSALILSYQAVDQGHITLLVTNQGVRPGSVRNLGGGVQVPILHQNNAYEVIDLVSSENTLVEPGKSVLVILSRKPKQGTCFTNYDNKARCEIVISATSFVGNSYALRAYAECGELDEIIWGQKYPPSFGCVPAP